MLEAKARWELHKDAVCCFEQILEAAPHKTATVLPPASHLTSHPIKTRHAGHCKDGLISDVLLLSSTHGHTSLSPSVNTYIHQFCPDTGCQLKDLPEVMDNRDWRWDSQGIYAISITWWGYMYTKLGCFTSK